MMNNISYKLESFEGPLDLLLHLISKHKLDIMNIEISLLLEQYLQYMDNLSEQDMEYVITSYSIHYTKLYDAQTPFSSINYGTDTSVEGRMVIKNILLANEAGLGNGETPIFPIHIFKIKEGINYNPTDPSYDLFKLVV